MRGHKWELSAQKGQHRYYKCEFCGEATERYANEPWPYGGQCKNAPPKEPKPARRKTDRGYWRTKIRSKS